MWSADQFIKILLAVEKDVAIDIRQLLKDNHQVNIIGEADNSFSVIELLKSGLVPDVILLDAVMLETSGRALITSIKSVKSDLNVVLFSASDDEMSVKEAFSLGAVGYLLKDSHPDEFIYALKKAGGGGRHLSSKLSLKIMNKLFKRSVFRSAQSAPDFSQREAEVLQLVAEGLTNVEMSEKLFLSKRTIEGHRQSLIEKTGMRNTAALIRYAVLNGIVQ